MWLNKKQVCSMLENLAYIVAIITFFIYVFIEWPRIQKRWRESLLNIEKVLLIFSFIVGVSGVSLLFWGLLNLLMNSSLIFLRLFGAGIALYGISMLVDYWVETKTLFYRPDTTLSSIWIYIWFMVLFGMIIIGFSWLGFI
jgi:hypothetical protein